ncbi:MAG TPA: SDR family oxidoreductase [Gammaproteobacteria bacterium]|nr:SDR family oxidoreductase [Gammaproteobacteria bacterium]
MLTRIICLCTIIFACSTAFAAANPNAKKTVLITGGMNGVGREIATAFKNDGWNVWVTSRNPSQYPELTGVTVRKLDLTDQAAVKQLMRDIQAKNGRLDVLVNNASYTLIGATEATSVTQAREIMDVNVIAPFLLTQEALPLMRASHGGHIINISSTSGLRALPGMGMYAASKMALEGLSEALAAETAQWNIKVSIIEPRGIKNEWIQNASIAEKINDYPGYKTFTSNLQNKLAKKVEEIGQQPQEMGQFVLKVANTAKPNLRYQTDSSGAALAHEILVDPSGNKMRDQTIAFSRELFELQ